MPEIMQDMSTLSLLPQGNLERSQVLEEREKHSYPKPGP